MSKIDRTIEGEVIFTKHEIISCTRCSGFGYNTLETIYNYHKNLKKAHYNDCEHCNKTGRVVKIVKVFHRPPTNKELRIRDG